MELENTTCGYWQLGEYIGRGRYKARCICGKERSLDRQTIERKASRSCGCKQKEIRAQSVANVRAKATFKASEKFE